MTFDMLEDQLSADHFGTTNVVLVPHVPVVRKPMLPDRKNCMSILQET